MKQLRKVLTQTKWNDASDTINHNSDTIYEAILQLENATTKHKGYFFSFHALQERYKTTEIGSIAFVYNETNDASTPYDIYEYTSRGWSDTGKDGGSVEVDIDGMQDKIYGYTEYHNGEYTEEATIATGAEPNIAQIKVDGKNHQIDLSVQRQDENDGVNATSLSITPDKVVVSGKLNVGQVTSQEQIILTTENEASPSVSLGGEDNDIQIASHDNDAVISVKDDTVVVNAPDIELHTEDREEGTEASIKLSKGNISFNYESLQVGLNELIPTVITKAEEEAKKNAGLWELFVANNPLIYVTEE